MSENWEDDVSDDGGAGGAEGAEVEEEEEEIDDSESEYDSDGQKLSRAQRTVCAHIVSLLIVYRGR